MRQRRILLATVVALIGVEPSAHAFCRAMTCGKKCEVDPITQCPMGTPLRWPQLCISYSMQVDASRQVNLQTATAVTENAFGAWGDVLCPTGVPSIQIQEKFGPVACKLHEYNRIDGNANIVMFHDDDWPVTSEEDALAVTTVTFDKNTGDIYDADIDVDGRQPLSTDATVDSSGYDLQSILAHEAGHFLGLSHSNDSEATMWSGYHLDARDLSEDDAAGICTIYPPTDAPNVCDFTPRQGFSPTCRIYPASLSSCSVAPSFGIGTEQRAVWAFGLFAFACCRRASRRRPSTRRR